MTVTPPKNGMTLFIGANNSGKSLLLRELSERATNPTMVSGNAHWVQDAQAENHGTSAEFLKWLSDRGHRSWCLQEGAPVQYRIGSGGSLTVDMVTQWWEHGRYNELRPLLMRAQWTDTRLQVEAQDPLWDFREPVFGGMGESHVGGGFGSRFAPSVQETGNFLGPRSAARTGATLIE
ncbi:hypothetical protein ACIPW5_25875 [Streptomyces sp. NPDC090077]|uniref:hypothetical protein n=1 Tax=Streptomyces sp. NPDC090077 TaxID=3365938 RepID=UPI003819F4FF